MENRKIKFLYALGGGALARSLLFLLLPALVCLSNPYSLEQSLTGSEVMSLSGGPYDLEVGWEDWTSSYLAPGNPYESSTPIHAFILLRTDLATGESVVLLDEGREVIPGWKRAGWFGFYFADLFPWVYHQNLGWLFVAQKDGEGVWFHQERLGWAWSNPGDFPYLYMINRDEWTYVNMDMNSPTLYDFAREEWFALNRKYRISATSNPSYGGYVSGVGEFYRWEQTTLVANASDGYLFREWTGGQSGNERSLPIEVFGDLEVGAEFVPVLTPEVSPEEALSNVVEVVQAMEKLTVVEKTQALVELLLFGKSETANFSLTGE